MTALWTLTRKFKCFMSENQRVQVITNWRIIYSFSETTAALAEFESNECIDRIRARWELQATRYGARLSICLTSSVAEIKNWNNIINDINSAAQASTTTQVPNAGAAVLAETNNFVSRDNLSRSINFRFRDLIFRFQPYLDRYEEFRASVVDNEEQIINELTQVIKNSSYILLQLI